MARALFAASALLVGSSLAGCASTYQTSGLVLRVDPPSRTLTISHDEVPGVMDAMVMPFEVRGHGETIGKVRPGDRVAFRLIVDGKSTHIDRVKLLSALPADAGAIATPMTPALVPIGHPIPEFALVNQHGETVSLSGLRGRVAVVTFIYTRCPLPDYCPRMITNLAAVRDRFRERLGRDLTLLTITFDPQYDTPERLAAFAKSQRADATGWHFLTGDAEAIRRVCDAFGVEYWPDAGLITHTLQTAVIDREGRLAAAVEGKGFTGRQLADLVALTLEQQGFKVPGFQGSKWFQ